MTKTRQTEKTKIQSHAEFRAFLNGLKQRPWRRDEYEVQRYSPTRGWISE